MTDERIRITQEFWSRAAANGAGDYVVPLEAGDELSRLALFRIAECLQTSKAATIVYGDQDEMDGTRGRINPWFKPSWNEELFLARDYLSRAMAIRTDIIRKALAATVATDMRILDLVLRASQEPDGEIIHLPHILTHVGKGRSSDLQSRVEAVGRHLAAVGAKAVPGRFDTVKVSWPLPSELPLVSIIIPTKDKVELLSACVESVLARTSYQHFEILIVDNASKEARTKAYLEVAGTREQVRVLSYPGPYNFSGINNWATRSAEGSYLCLLNNDTEVLEKDWLTEMMRYAVRPEVGAVGAKLLYPDRTVQHAGVIVGMGDAAGHAHRNLPSQERGYFDYVHVPHFVSAVTGACLLVDKRKFLAVGGLDEQSLAIAYNDIDFCLKLELAGWRNVYVPHAVLIHHESKSRGKDHSRSQIGRYRKELNVFQQRWGTRTYKDPMFNPNLDRSSETFLIQL